VHDEVYVVGFCEEAVEIDERIVLERGAQAVEQGLDDEGRRLEKQAAPRAAACERVASVGKEAAGDRH
jgi:hypothetical protein